MQECAPDSQEIIPPSCPQQAGHPNPGKDKTNLGHRGTGQRPFQVNGKKRQQRSQEHGRQPQSSNQKPPGPVRTKDTAGDSNDAKYPCLCQYTGEQGTGRSRGHRMGLGKPDMKRETSCLCSKPKQKHSSGPIQPPLIPCVPGYFNSLSQSIHFQCP